MSKADGSKRARFGVSKKLLLSIILITVLICAVSTFSGYYQYDNTIRKLYNDNGYVVGNIILDNIDHDKVGQYAKTWTQDGDYEKIADYIRNVKYASDAAHIYIVTVNEDRTVRYVFDSYAETQLGDTYPVSYYFDEVWAAYTKGTRPDSYMVRHSKEYGYEIGYSPSDDLPFRM